ncbi:MAG: fatty acid desaturase [Mesorhizobium sp.]|uniref:fatty acid desaturase n=1 Tax=Mesorhizobium sp. TaxID=1871066 RepID=UPI000FE63D1A|nr:fatty acid desaturase [Mesorhizobium sp.]RWO94300.1 MAG: fatty acid desaturase [Mesorhizobium sp.]
MSVKTDRSEDVAANASPPDYSLTGHSARRAVEAGLVAAEWYHPEVPRKLMKELMQRSDQPAVRHTLMWLALHVIFAAGGILFWGSWWALPFWFAYGVIYGSGCDSRWHECGHGTMFRTPWMNDLVYHIASFQVMWNPTSWRWSHVRHHTDTIIVGRDPEIDWQHPIKLVLKTFMFVGVVDVCSNLKKLARQAAGTLTADEKDYTLESDWPKVVFWARVHMMIYAATIIASFCMFLAGMGWKATIPLLLIGGPRVYGCWHGVMTGLLQHGGLAENVLDHRLNSRTVYMNPISRFLYCNMGYHVEHHLFPMVPYHALPRLHEAIKHDLPPANPSIWNAYREMFRAVMRQRREPGYYLRRELPPTAQPYCEDLHVSIPERTFE